MPQTLIRPRISTAKGVVCACMHTCVPACLPACMCVCHVSVGLSHGYPVPSLPKRGLTPITQQVQDLGAWPDASLVSCRGEKVALTGNECTTGYVFDLGSNPEPLAVHDDAPSAWSLFQARPYCHVPFNGRSAVASEPGRESWTWFPVDNTPFPGCPMDGKLGLCCFLSLICC